MAAPRGRGGKRAGQSSRRATRLDNGHRHDYDAARKEAERREGILADRLRVAAKWRPKIPEVRKVNFENFKNHFYSPEEPDYAIEVLMAAPNIQAQIRREQASRRKEESARTRQLYMAAYGYEYPTFMPRRLTKDVPSGKASKKAEAAEPHETQMQRVRIQSQPVLGHLTSLLNETERRSTPRTFVRPFKPLVYLQPKMKDILATLEEKWGDVEELENDDEEGVKSGEESSKADSQDEEGEDDTESLASVDSNVDDQEIIMDSVEALRDMRCYVNFVEKEIMPMFQKYEGTQARNVKFDDLWSVFRVGDLLYMPAASETAGRYHEVWRVYRTKTPDVDTAYPKSGWEFFADELDESKKNKVFTVYAYYIDHDGTSFGAVRHKFELPSFAGERAIDSLEVFPLRFQEDHEQIVESLEKQGHKFQQYANPTDRHQSYNAWTLTRNPPHDTDIVDSEILQDDRGEDMRHPEFIESDVIVDMAEAYQKHPDWRPEFHKLTVSKSIRCSAEVDEMDVQQWFDGARITLAYSSTEMIQTADGVEMMQRRENLNTDLFLRQRVKGSRSSEKKPLDMKLRDEDRVLLPKRMFAYALRERRFAPVDLNFLRPIRREQGVFESLRISEDYKDIVRGLVVSHFQKKSLERRYAEIPAEGPGQDLIQGKGRGLVVLLHGVPGVGKTATAEAVAMENHKPLFVITCGDLGLSAHEVESSLTNVFRLAHLWDCVLLLDEADVFLTQRSQDDMQRNALVSVFLRVLEYYNGLLFLTTNRVASIDDAFKSRIHMSLYYAPLDKTQTRDIFRLNVAKLRDIERQRHAMTGEPQLVIDDEDITSFAAQHYEDHARSTGCWNGRQIRNAFQIASSLAHHVFAQQVDAARRKGTQPPVAPVLNRVLFEKVQMSTESFDKHMKETRGIER